MSPRRAFLVAQIGDPIVKRTMILLTRLGRCAQDPTARRVGLLALLLATFSASVFAADPIPGDACSTADSYQWSGGPEAAGKAYLMTCQGSVWVRILETSATGFVGVKQAAPKTPLDVAGEVKLGVSTGLACNSNTAGGMRYNSTSKLIEFCNQTAWGPLLTTVACDSTPAAFTFADQTSQVVSTLIPSNIIAISDTAPACTSIVSVSGDGGPQYRTCSDSICSSVLQDWTADNKSLVMNGPRYLQVRTTTSASSATTHHVSITVGAVSDNWSLTTSNPGPCGDVGPGDVGTVCSDGSVYAGITPDGNRHMYVPRCDLGMSWDGAACSGARDSLAWNNGNSSDTVQTFANSGVSGSLHTAELLTIDSDSATGGIQPHLAAKACADLSDHGKGDWYLPAISELSVIYSNLQDGTPQDNSPDPIISGLTTSSYWSSTELGNSSGHAQARSFTSGGVSNLLKQNTYAVRCARKE